MRKVATTTGVTDYTLHGKNVVHLTNGTNSLHFYYDAQNRPAVVEFNWVPYAYVHNLQGDIIAIVDSAGTKVVEYKYDAWGKPIAKTGSLASTLGTLNPFRYRGYVYDEETELYYLRSRYYNAQFQRFINCDSILGKIAKLFSLNPFAYVGNSPLTNVDPLGFSSEHISFDSAWKDILGSIEIDAGIGFGYYASTNMRWGASTITVGVGAKVDIVSVGYDEGKFDYGGGYSIGASIATKSFRMQGESPLSLGLEKSVYHTYQNDARCTCDLAFDGMFDCPVADATAINLRPSGIDAVLPTGSFDVGFSFAYYKGVGGNISVSVNVEQFLSGVDKLAKSIVNWFYGLF